MTRRFAAPLVLLGLAGCGDEAPGPVLGSTEWDRVELIAEATEPVVAIEVREGRRVEAGAILLRLDPRRTEAALAEIRAERRRLEALLAEQRHGARPEAIDEARARLRRAESLARNAAQELARVRKVREQKLVSAAELDRAEAAHAAAAAEARAARAALELLLNGTRVEQIEQTEAALAAAEAREARTRLTLERLTVRAPRAGRVDAIPVEVGDQPLQGAPVLMLLVGDAPYVRAYVPERVRTTIREGSRFRVEVEGIAQPFEARARHVANEASFTPYFALTGDDASRLVYLAELELLGEPARELPGGLPARAFPLDE